VAVSEGRPLRVNFLLEDTALFGGVKIQLHHANLLHRRGHEVRVISRGLRPDWYGVEAPFLTVPEFNAETVPVADLNIATYWTTIRPAALLPEGRAVHYCQGFEASYTHNRDEHQQILEAYSLPLPAFARSPHLADLVRISQWPLIDAERELAEPDEFHCHLSPPEVARTVAACDLLLAPSWDQEGFGMPVLEAMACGVPVVASRIAAFEGFASSAASLVSPHDARGFAEAARRVLTDRPRWRRMRRTGLSTAQRFSERRVVREVETALRWGMATDVEPLP
jgi:glycosyltransferase involved in cell wall biosynthesis